MSKSIVDETLQKSKEKSSPKGKNKKKSASKSKTKSKAKSKDSKESVSKSRFFCFLLYPDSAPEDFMTKLICLGQPMAISPLHDKDVAEVDKESGEVRYKKPHWHVIYIANNSVTADSVRKKLQRALGKEAVAMVKICDSVANYYKYLTHESADAIAKGKHLYDKSDIHIINNFDIDRYTDLSKEAKDDALMLLCDIIRREKLANVIELMDYIETHNIPGMSKFVAFQAIRASTSTVRLFLDGVYQIKNPKPNK